MEQADVMKCWQINADKCKIVYTKKSIGGVGGAVGCNQSVESITNIVTTNKPDISITPVVTSPPFSNSQQHQGKVP